MLKRKGLIITIIIFFLLVNTTYFWERNLGIFAIPADLVVVIVYLVLAVGLLWQLYQAIREKFSDRKRLFLVRLLMIVLILTFFFPGGVINFDKLEGKDLLVAQREGVANCMTTLKLKENNKFIESSICFGMGETRGTYELKGDTVFFRNVTLARDQSEYYKFAILKKSNSDYKGNKILGDLVRYQNYGDTTGVPLWIIKNDLKK